MLNRCNSGEVFAASSALEKIAEKGAGCVGIMHREVGTVNGVGDVIDVGMQGEIEVRGRKYMSDGEAERPKRKFRNGIFAGLQRGLQFAVFQELQDCRIFRSCRS